MGEGKSYAKQRNKKRKKENQCFVYCVSILALVLKKEDKLVWKKKVKQREKEERRISNHSSSGKKEDK